MDRSVLPELNCATGTIPTYCLPPLQYSSMHESCDDEDEELVNFVYLYDVTSSQGIDESLLKAHTSKYVHMCVTYGAMCALLKNFYNKEKSPNVRGYTLCIYTAWYTSLCVHPA